MLGLSRRCDAGSVQRDLSQRRFSSLSARLRRAGLAQTLSKFAGTRAQCSGEEQWRLCEQGRQHLLRLDFAACLLPWHGRQGRSLVQEEEEAGRRGELELLLVLHAAALLQHSPALGELTLLPKQQGARAMGRNPWPTRPGSRTVRVRHLVED